MARPIEGTGIAEKTLRDVCYVAFRQRWKAVFLFVGIAALVTIYAYVADEIYSSEGKLFVRMGRESVALDPTATVGDVVSIRESRESEINSILDIIRSRAVAEAVVDHIGSYAILHPHDDSVTGEPSVTGIARDVTRDARTESKRVAKDFRKLLATLDLVAEPDDHEDAVLTIMKHLKVEALSSSYLISIVYETANPRVAQQVVDQVIRLYLDKHIEVNRTTGSYQFFLDQTKDLRERVDEVSASLTQTRNESKIASVSDERRTLTDFIGTLRSQLGTVEAEYAAVLARVTTAKQLVTSVSPTQVTEETSGIERVSSDNLLTNLNDLKVQEQELLTRYREGSKPVEEIRRQIKKAEELLKTQEPDRKTVTTGINAAQMDLKVNLLRDQVLEASLKAKISSITEHLSAADQDLIRLNSSIRVIEDLERERDNLATSYQEYSSKLQEARTNDVLESNKISNISVVQPASLSTEPIRPKKLVLILLGVILGALIGGVGAFFFEFMDRSFKRPEDIETRLKLDTLTAIERLPRGDVRPVRAPARGAGTKTAYTVPTALAHSFHSLRDRLMLLPDQESPVPRTLAVVSSQPGEGVTTVAANLALALAMDGTSRVLLLDCNMENPALDRFFETAQGPGVSDLTDGHTAELIEGIPIHSRLDLLPAGSDRGSSSEYTLADRLAALMPRWMDHYTYVVFDLPAIGRSTLSARLAGKVDGVILVVQAERTRYEVAQRVQSLLHAAHAKVLGVVFNQRRFHVPGWVYRRL